MLDTTVWIAQSLLGLFFFAAGMPKVLGRGIDRWVGFDDLPRPMVIVIGIAEIAAGVALVAPMLFDELEWTTPLAAVGIATISLMASGFHIRAKEWLPAAETASWSTLAGAVAVGRWEETSTGPSVSADVLVPVIGVVVPAIIANLAILLRQPVQPALSEQERGVTG
ncbi:MAG: DoxX family protein [Actinomycetota bacterium]|nr:DoxX family protein [Actinomycetota bacterium]